MSRRPLFFPWLSISPFSLPLSVGSEHHMLQMINCLFDLEITSAEEGQGGRCTFNRITRCHSQTQPEQHTVFLWANKWGLAAAWPRSFSLMSWRNRQSLRGHNTQEDSSITTPALSAHLPVENPAWLSRGEGHNLCHKIGRLRMIPYRLAGI